MFLFQNFSNFDKNNMSPQKKNDYIYPVAGLIVALAVLAIIKKILVPDIGNGRSVLDLILALEAAAGALILGKWIISELLELRDKIFQKKIDVHGDSKSDLVRISSIVICMVASAAIYIALHKFGDINAEKKNVPVGVRNDKSEQK